MKTVDKRNNKLAYLIIGVVIFAAIIITIVISRI